MCFAATILLLSVVPKKNSGSPCRTDVDTLIHVVFCEYFANYPRRLPPPPPPLPPPRFPI